jgi:hypothetical protein
MQFQLSHPELVLDLVGFLHRAELRAEEVGPAIVEIESPRSADQYEARHEIDLTLRVWGLLHPDVSVTPLSAGSDLPV